MASGFPSSIDAFPAPGAAVPMNTPGTLEHDIQHANVNDAITKIQTYLGVTGSGVATTITKKLADVISQSASNTATVATLSSTVTGFTTSIANLQSANVNGPAAQGQIFVPAGPTAGTDINTAIAALPAAGGTVLLGAGTHTIDTAVSLNKSGVSIVGMGINATLLQFNTSVVPIAIKMADTTQRRFFLRDFSIQTTTGSAGAGTAIGAQFFVDSVIERVHIGGGATTSPLVGINFDAGVTGTFYNEVRNCRIFVTATGVPCFGINFANNSNSNSVSNTRIGAVGNNVTGFGIVVNTAYAIRLDHVDIESCDMIGVDAVGNTGTRDITLVNCYFEAITIGVRVGAGVRTLTMVGGTINNCTTADFQDNGGESVQIINATVEQHGYGYKSHPASRVIRTAGTFSLTHAEVYGASALRIRLSGGGGAGGGAATTAGTTASAGGGGQAGAYTEATVSVESLTYPVSIVIGAGGTGVAGANGGAGGNSTFGSTIMTAPGGNPGQVMVAGTAVSIAPGGQGSNAGSTAAPVSGTTAIILAGGEGTSGYRVVTPPAGQWAGNGGANPLGAAIAGPTTNGTAAGRNGFQYGSGGSGAINGVTQTQVAGGNGADGVCIIELIY